MNIASENGCESPDISRKKLKDLIMEEIPNVEFCKPRKANESERVVLKSTRDFAIAEAEVRDESLSDELKSLFDAAKILRKAVIDSEKWEFTGDLTNANEKHVPNKLVHFFSWFIRGASDIKDEKKKILVEKITQSLDQNAIYACLTPRQVLNKTSEAFYNTHELPQQLAVGLAVHQATRSEKLLQLLHGLGLSVDHTRILKIETRIAMEEIRRMEMNGGAYLPPDISLGRFVFFAVDNVDFSEDTPDGKRTLHGTAMTIYQQYKEGDVTKPLKFTEATLTSSLTQIPRTITELLPCHVPGNVKPKIPSHKRFKLEEKYRLSGYETDDLAWLFAKNLHFKNEVEKPNQCGIQDKTLVEGDGETAGLIDKAAILGNDDHLLCELQQNTEEEVLV